MWISILHICYSLKVRIHFMVAYCEQIRQEKYSKA